MESANFAFLGEPELAAGLGKKGTCTDLCMYDRKQDGWLRTYVAPCGFPEKIQPLVQAVNMTESAILHVSALDRFAGEQIVALDLLGAGQGVLCHSESVDPGKLEDAVRGTVVEKYRRTSPADLSSAIAGIRPAPKQGPARVLVDHCFDVKGVGTVVLGKVASGTVRRHDSLKLAPGGAEALVKSIQMHDDPVDEASWPARVGLAVKCAAPMRRGDVLCAEEPPREISSATLDFAPTKYYKEGLREGLTCVTVCGLQARAARIDSVDPFVLSFDKPVAYSGETVAVLRPESSPVRIVGGGRVAEP